MRLAAAAALVFLVSACAPAAVEPEPPVEHFPSVWRRRPAVLLEPLIPAPTGRVSGSLGRGLVTQHGEVVGYFVDFGDPARSPVPPPLLDDEWGLLTQYLVESSREGADIEGLRVLHRGGIWVEGVVAEGGSVRPGDEIPAVAGRVRSCSDFNGRTFAAIDCVFEYVPWGRTVPVTRAGGRVGEVVLTGLTPGTVCADPMRGFGEYCGTQVGDAVSVRDMLDWEEFGDQFTFSTEGFQAEPR